MLKPLTSRKTRASGILAHTMPRNARIPKVDRADPRLLKILQLLQEVADEECGPSATDEEHTKVIHAAGEEALRILARRRGER